MSYASAVVFSLPQADLRPLRRALRTARYVIVGTAQALGFAAALYLVVAGAGLLCDPASTVPLQAQASR